MDAYVCMYICIYIYIYIYIYTYIYYSYMYHVFDAWQVNMVINNEQSLETPLAFVAKLGAVVSC